MGIRPCPTTEAKYSYVTLTLCLPKQGIYDTKRLE